MRTALVTGAGRRVGAVIARGLAHDGARVIAHYNRSRAEAEEVAGVIRATGGWCETVQADLSDRGAVMALIPDCVARFGVVDVLVNNASSFLYDNLASMSPATWDAHLAPNLCAPVFLVQALAKALGPHRQGAVINILDHKVTALNPDFFSYTIAKLAHAGATRLLAQALEGRVRVNGIAPGITLLSGKQTEAGFKKAWSAPPLGRSSTPAELLDACRFILDIPSLNGEILVLDGGESLIGRARDVAFESGQLA